jgi:hypothetical protein
MRVFGKDITSPVKEKPVVVSADAVEGDDLDAGDAAVKADEDGGNDAVDMDAGEAVKMEADAVMVDAE